MKKLLTILFIFLAFQLKAQEFKNIKFTQPQEGNIVTITYDLKDNNPYQLYTVKVYYSDNKNKSYIQLFKLQGDAGSGVKAGTDKKIYWDAAQEFGSIVKTSVQFKLIAKPLYNAETLAWLEAKDKNSCESYTLYLQKYPQGDFYIEAKATKEELCKNTFADYTETVNGVAFDMVAIKGGSFTMGSPKSEPNHYFDEVQHKVTVSDFYMGKYEVTQAQYQAVMGKNPAENNGVGDNYPVYYVSWYDAVEFCNKLSEKAGLPPYYNIDKNTKDPNNKNDYDGKKWTVSINKDAKGYRLPTEAEWEYVARGGVETHGRASHEYAGSDNIDEVAWYWQNSGDKKLSGEWDDGKIVKNNCKTHPVGEKKPNELGIYDMSGNLWEWCYDWYGTYEKVAIENPQGAKNGSSRVYRGGSWDDDAGYCRVAYRNCWYPNRRDDNIGFRLALVP